MHGPPYPTNNSTPLDLLITCVANFNLPSRLYNIMHNIECTYPIPPQHTFVFLFAPFAKHLSSWEGAGNNKGKRKGEDWEKVIKQ